MSIAQKPLEVTIKLSQFPYQKVYVNFICETVYLSPRSNRLVVFCLIYSPAPVQYAFGVAILSRNMHALSELEEVAYLEAVMDLTGDYVDSLPIRYQVKAECRLWDEFSQGLRLARTMRELPTALAVELRHG